MNKQKKKEAAERELRWESLKKQTLTMILDKEGGHPAQMDALLIHSIGKASKSADRLSRRIFWLNVILVVIGALSLSVAGYSVLFE